MNPHGNQADIWGLPSITLHILSVPRAIIFGLFTAVFGQFVHGQLDSVQTQTSTGLYSAFST